MVRRLTHDELRSGHLRPVSSTETASAQILAQMWNPKLAKSSKHGAKGILPAGLGTIKVWARRSSKTRADSCAENATFG